MAQKPQRMTAAEIRALAEHEAREGCKLDEMLNRGELPSREALEASLLKALTRGSEA